MCKLENWQGPLAERAAILAAAGAAALSRPFGPQLPSLGSINRTAKTDSSLCRHSCPTKPCTAFACWGAISTESAVRIFCKSIYGSAADLSDSCSNSTIRPRRHQASRQASAPLLPARRVLSLPLLAGLRLLPAGHLLRRRLFASPPSHAPASCRRSSFPIQRTTP